MNKLAARSQSFIVLKARRPGESLYGRKLPLAPVLKQRSSVKEYKLRIKSNLAGSFNNTLGNASRNLDQPIKGMDSIKPRQSQSDLVNLRTLDNSKCKEILVGCIKNLKQLEIENNSVKTKLSPILDLMNQVVLQLEHELTLVTNFNQMLQKLENLSKENIELLAKHEKYEFLILSMKKSKNLDQNLLRTEKLVKEIGEQNEYIGRCEEEIRELKRREIKMLKKLDRKVYNCADKTLADTDESPIANYSRCEFRKYSIPVLKLPE